MHFLLNPLIKKEEWNKFVAENGGSFLQVWEWGNFQQQSGHDVTRAVVKDGGRIALAAQILKYTLPFGKSYIYIPYGPVAARNCSNKQELFEFFVQELKKSEAISKGTIFLKIEPDEVFIPDFSASGFKKSDKDIQARETLIADVSKSEEELLARMKQKTRYNINLARRHGVEIISIDDKKKAKKIFLSLLIETAKRNNFKTHPEKYYVEMMEMFLSGRVADNSFFERLFFARYHGKIITMALIGFFGGRATYLHGGSSDEYKNVMAPYLLHWEIMREAKQLGCSEYDFWGIVTLKTDKKQAQKWLGFSRFKEGFGGRIVEYSGAYDLVFDKLWYNAYKLVRKVKIF